MRALLVAALLLSAGPAAAGAPGVCRARAVVTPQRAVVGQQVLYRASIERSGEVERVEWLRAPAFPDFRVEWLPGRAERSELREDGTRHWLREERRALFPARAGTLTLPAASLRCTLGAAAGSAPEIRESDMPSLVLHVVPPPQSGRPDDFSGLVGPVALRLTASPRRLTLGETLRVSIGLLGAANLWDQTAPIGSAAFEENSPRADVFSSRSELDLEPGERLYARRFFHFELVPREPGRLRLPALRVSYYDPQRAEYAWARAPALEIEVEPRGAVRPTTTRGESLSRSASRPHTGAPDRGAPLLVPGVVLGLLVSAGVGWPILERRRRRWRPVQQALARAEAAAAAADPRAEAAALQRALRAALAQLSPDLADAPVEELSRRADDEASLQRIAEQLRLLDRARYAAGPSPPDRRAVEATLAAVRRGRWASARTHQEPCARCGASARNAESGRRR